jgi:hypothetical protein
LGLDVHAETIAVAVAEPEGEVRSRGPIANREDAIRKLNPRRKFATGSAGLALLAQNRLHKRYMKLMAAGKDQRKVMTAVGRELMGFIWAIGVKAEAACMQQKAA